MRLGRDHTANLGLAGRASSHLGPLPGRSADPAPVGPQRGCLIPAAQNAFVGSSDSTALEFKFTDSSDYGRLRAASLTLATPARLERAPPRAIVALDAAGAPYWLPLYGHARTTLHGGFPLFRSANGRSRVFVNPPDPESTTDVAALRAIADEADPTARVHDTAIPGLSAGGVPLLLYKPAYETQFKLVVASTLLEISGGLISGSIELSGPVQHAEAATTGTIAVSEAAGGTHFLATEPADTAGVLHYDLVESPAGRVHRIYPVGPGTEHVVPREPGVDALSPTTVTL